MGRPSDAGNGKKRQCNKPDSGELKRLATCVRRTNFMPPKSISACGDRAAKVRKVLIRFNRSARAPRGSLWGHSAALEQGRSPRQRCWRSGSIPRYSLRSATRAALPEDIAIPRSPPRTRATPVLRHAETDLASAAGSPAVSLPRGTRRNPVCASLETSHRTHPVPA